MYIDNWFTTLDLLIYLKKSGIHCCDTLRANRLQGCPLLSNKMLKQKGRVAIDHQSDLISGNIVAKWMDNNAVHVASNFVGVEPIGTVKRWSGEHKSKIDIECPQLVLFYNKGMGGVDLADMLIFSLPNSMQDFPALC